ncbi:MAG: protein translocase subunit SecD [bacterium]
MSKLKRIFKPRGRGKLWWLFLFITIIGIYAFFIDFSSSYNKAAEKLNMPIVKEVPFRLGLDLLGGTQLIYEADVSGFPATDRASAVDGARDVIERRVNFFGVSEPLVQVNHTTDGDYRIIVELAGIKDVKEAIKQIGETPLLEFKEENNEPQRELTEEEKKQIEADNETARKNADQAVSKLDSGQDFAKVAKEYSEDAFTKNDGGSLGWINIETHPNIFFLVNKLVEELGLNAAKEMGQTRDGIEILKAHDVRAKLDEKNQVIKEIHASHILICYDGSTGCEKDTSKKDALVKINELKAQATADNFVDLAKKNSTEPGADESGGDLGWFGRGAMVQPFEEAVFSQKIGTISDVVETEFGYHLIYKKAERSINEYNVSHIFIDIKTPEDILGLQNDWKNTELTGKNLKRATVAFNPNDNMPEVSLEFDKEGSDLFEDITGRNIGKPVAIFLDGYPISVPNVNEKISGGRAVISGNFSITEAKTLVKRLNAGALPVPIKLINQQTIGASLGKISVENSLKAGVIGLILVALFMLFYYRLLGLLSVFSLLIYGLITLAIFKLWPVTMTLAGAAGFILSVGMAVDANVLIFERFKEELRSGRTLSRAIDEGFARAWTSIRDGNFTTIITTIILMFFSTSIIKGFAVTLFLGVLVSMFTAIIVTKNFLKLINERWLEKYKWLVGVK